MNDQNFTVQANQFKGLLLGIAAGDALGVPVKGVEREELIQNPVTNLFEMRNESIPTGTYSAGTALSLCLSESLLEHMSLETVIENFLLWSKENFWTAQGQKLYADEEVLAAIQKVEQGIPIKSTGRNDAAAHTTSATVLMRISPLVFFLIGKPLHKRHEIVKQIVSITHSDAITITSCFYLLEFLLELLQGKEKFKIYTDLPEKLTLFLKSVFVRKSELEALHSIFEEKIFDKTENEIKTSPYIIDCLEASLWCFLNARNFKDAALLAVNLGGNTNTVGSVTGALAGICLGAKNIPTSWLNSLARHDEIENLAMKIYFKIRDEQTGNLQPNI